MRKKLQIVFICALFLLLFAVSAMAQAPNSFNYQAVVRDASGNVLQNQSIALRIAILQNSPTGTELYAERHLKTTNAFGLVNLEIGTGSVLGGNFSSIQWGTITPYLKIGIDLAGGNSYTDFGTSKIASVPYASLAGQVSYLQLDPVNQSISLQAIASAADEDPIFEIRNKDGIVMLGVYNEGVRINVLEEESKGSKSGFAVGSFSRETKSDPTEIMRLTSDSVRFYIPDHPAGKSSRSGFAVGSFSRETKGAYFDLLDISPEWARIYIDDSGAKSSRSGFAVGSFSRETKADTVNFMNITPLNYFIGHSAGQSNTTGNYNQFIGFESGQSNTTGMRNTFNGYRTGKSNVSGSSNVFIGNEAGYSNTEGLLNIFIGGASGYSNITGSYNIYIGQQSGGKSAEATENVFIGSYTGYQNTSGFQNVFIGMMAGKDNTVGKYNTFLGSYSGWKNTTSDMNVFVGTYSGWNNESGSNNVFLGNHSGSKNVSGNSNTIIGSWSGWENIEGSGNVFLGTSAGSSETGSNKLYIHNNSLGPEWALIYGEFDNSKLRLNAEVTIRDLMVLQPRNEPPVNPEKGTIYYDNANNSLRLWNGVEWKTISTE
jgi:trimeric autotransporter adhesin